MLTRILSFISLSWAFQLFSRLGDKISPKGAPLIHIRLKGGECVYQSGVLSSSSTQMILDLLKDSNVPNAVVKKYKDKGFIFSQSIPEKNRQKLRNILSLN